MLYHALCVSGLERLVPHPSTHQTPYVYAIKSKLAAMLFGAPKDDFDLLIDFAEGKPILYECYPEALKKVYSGKSCSIYTVEETGFQTGMTGWEEEPVCSLPVDVVCEEVMADIYTQLMSAAEKAQCIIQPFDPEGEYMPVIREELAERIQTFGITEADMKKDERISKYHNCLLSG